MAQGDTKWKVSGPQSCRINKASFTIRRTGYLTWSQNGKHLPRSKQTLWDLERPCHFLQMVRGIIYRQTMSDSIHYHPLLHPWRCTCDSWKANFHFHYRHINLEGTPALVASVSVPKSKSSPVPFSVQGKVKPTAPSSTATSLQSARLHMTQSWWEGRSPRGWPGYRGQGCRARLAPTRSASEGPRRRKTKPLAQQGSKKTILYC